MRVSNSGVAALLIPLESENLEAAFNYLQREDKVYLGCGAKIERAARLSIKHVYFKAKGESSACAIADFISLETENPSHNRLPGNENLLARYYYGFKNLRRILPTVALTDFKYYRTGKQLRNDVPGACIVQELGS